MDTTKDFERKNHIHLVLYDNHVLSIWFFYWLDSPYCLSVYQVRCADCAYSMLEQYLA